MFSRSLISSSRQQVSALRIAPSFGSIRCYSTPSEDSVKGEKNSKSPQDLQKETAAKAHAEKADQRQETGSEAAVHGEKHNKSPEELAKETAAQAEHKK